MAGSDTTTFAALLKNHYYGTKNTIPDLTYGESPFFSLVTKKEDAGLTNVWPILYGHNPNASATFSDAQTYAGGSKSKAWNVTLVDHYVVATLTGRLIAVTKGDLNAFMRAATLEVDSAFSGSARRLSLHMFRDGWGDLGQVNETSGTTVTLYDQTNQRKDYARNFEVGMKICFSDTQASAVLRDTADFLGVTAVDEAAGTLTVDATLANISGIATKDFIFPKGERESSTTPTRLVMSGLGAWVPTTSPDSTAYFGVDRTAHLTRLAGQRVTGTAKYIKEVVRELAVKISAAGGKPDYCFIGYDRWENLAAELSGNIEYMDIKPGETAVHGFRAIVINGPKGPIKIMADNACPEDRMYMLQLDTWTLLSAGKHVRFLDEDDQQMLRQSTSDGYEIRVGGYHQLVCTAPGFNGVATLSTT